MDYQSTRYGITACSCREVTGPSAARGARLAAAVDVIAQVKFLFALQTMTGHHDESYNGDPLDYHSMKTMTTR